jgi:hypothetical protein
MLELSEDSVVTLNHTEFVNFVEDEWDWTRNFAISNSGYVGIGSNSPASALFVSKYKKYLGKDEEQQDTF